MKVVKSGQVKDNRCIRTKAENALKLSQIPQRGLSITQQLASALNITALDSDEVMILPEPAVSTH